MSTSTSTRAAPATSSLAASSKFKTFAVTFAVAGALIYVICLIMNWPMFTFHPATNRIVWGWEASRSGEGPAMYWYGWTATTVVGAAVLGLLATLLPESAAKKFPIFLVWLVPILVVPYLIWDLRQWWLHP